MGWILLLSFLGIGAAALAFGSGDDDPGIPAENDGTRPDEDTTDTDPDDQTVITGTDGADTLSADGKELLRGRAGPDTIQSGGDTEAYGDTGPDRITLTDRANGYGGFGADTIDAADESTAYGGSNSDVLNGTGNSSLYGDDGNDVLSWVSGKSDEEADALLRGGNGDDRLSVMSAEGHDVEVQGDAGNDVLSIRRDARGFGGAGNDTLFSDNGGTLSGGSGADLFFVNSLSNVSFDNPSDTVTITDFDRTQDRLRIDLNGPPSDITLTDDGTDTTISIRWEKEDPLGFEKGPVNSTIVIKGVTGLALDDVTFSRGSTYTSASGQSDDAPPPSEGTYDDIRIGTDDPDRITLSGDQPLILAGGGADSVIGAASERRGYVTLGDGNDSFTDGTGRAFVYGGAGNDAYTSDANATVQREANDTDGTDAFFGGDGDDSATITASGPGPANPADRGAYILSMGAGNDTVTIAAAATQGADISDGDGDDTIRAWMGTHVLSGDGDDTITFGIHADHVTADRGPATIRNLDASDRLILEIDRALTGALTAVEIPYDPATEAGPWTELRVGGVTVAIVYEQGFKLDDPRITVTRDVTFA